jgi:CheY-like chemotaxis protein
MPSVLICAPDPLTDEMLGTLLWRDGVERHLASTFQDGLVMAVAARPDLVVVDALLREADRLVGDLRLEAATSSVSIVVVARGDFDPSELRFLEAGANAILRLPPGPEWDERLSPLLLVPTRRAMRLAVELQLEAQLANTVRKVSGTVLNVSETGMLVETDISLPPATDIDFRIWLRDKNSPVLGCGQIVRQDSEHVSGVRFYGLEGDGLARVRALFGPWARSA